MNITSKHIKYLQREFILDEVSIPVESQRISANGKIYWVSIQEFCVSKNKPKAESLLAGFSDFLSGLHHLGNDVLLLINGEGSGIKVNIGIRIDNDISTRSGNISGTGGSHADVLLSLLKSAYPGVKGNVLTEESLQEVRSHLDSLGKCSLVVGTPSIQNEIVSDLARGLRGGKWSYLVMATPIEMAETTKQRNLVLNEKRDVFDEISASGNTKPIAQNYVELLDLLLERFDQGRNTGMWQQTTYCLTQSDRAFEIGQAHLRSALANRKQTVDPVYILDATNVIEYARNMLPLPHNAPEGPGNIQFPFRYQSCVTTKALTSWFHPPVEDFPGYSIRKTVRFSVSTALPSKKSSISLGKLIDLGEQIDSDCSVDTSSLDSHALIVGTTGSGKTNTVFHLLRQLHSDNIPFLVIEPAKSEYRTLLKYPEFSDLRIYRLGSESPSPFRLNPFEIQPGVSVQSHIDGLKAVFNSAFSMHAAMPHVLERVLHRVYEKRGWDLVSNSNSRGLGPMAQPTLSDMLRQVDQVVRSLGYEKRTEMDLRAALMTRINSLRVGGKGFMLDARESIPMSSLLKHSTILELDPVADDEEKSFVIGLLLMFLSEYRSQIEGSNSEGLKHVAVVEEAHRLLRHVPESVGHEMASSRAKGVEMFTNLLSEVRAYGQGLMIVDQIPSKLAPDVIKNTNLKIIHRLISREDQMLVGGSMGLSPDEQYETTHLSSGQAIVYSSQLDGAALAQVPFNKPGDDMHHGQIDDEFVSKRMISAHHDDGINIECQSDKDTFALRQEVEGFALSSKWSKKVWRFIQTALVDRECWMEGLREIEGRFVRSYPYGSVHGTFSSGPLRAAFIISCEEFFDLRARQYRWGHAQTLDIKSDFMNVVDMHHELDVGTGAENNVDSIKPELEELHIKYNSLCTVSVLPYDLCSYVCTDMCCKYRYSISPLLRNDSLCDFYLKARKDPASGEDKLKMLGRAAGSIAKRAVMQGASGETLKLAGLCYVAQMEDSLPPMDFRSKATR